MEGGNRLQNGWSEYGHLVLSKLEELQGEHKEIRKSLDLIHSRLTTLEASQEKIKSLETWRDSVTETWSAKQMKEAKDEIYDQKTKWTVGYGVFIAAQVIWAFILFFKDKLFK